ncbi:MAG: hypothetical protein KTR35_14590 [Gammaproteobacteria bacterium]|nr:hypothetical protein [Gammaproteobacteria bacterium]
MKRTLAISALLAPFVVSAACAQSNDPYSLSLEPELDDAPFELDPEELTPIRFTRSTEIDEEPVFDTERQTEFSFKLKPALPDFSREGGFGLNMFGTPVVDVRSSDSDTGYAYQEHFPDLHNGFSYSAGVKIEHEDKDIDGTAYVSSSMLGLSYGRLGRVWYGGVDVNLEKFDDDIHGADQSDVLSLDVTTGRRLGLTGLTSASPLWLLSLQGDFDMNELESDADPLESSSSWFLNPSLFWENRKFTFSAQLQLPVEAVTDDSVENPDYRLRAVFKKRFW